MPLGETATAPSGSVGVMASACLEEEIVETREAPTMRGRGSQLELREEQARSCGWRTGSYYRGSRVMPVEERALTSDVLLKKERTGD